MMLNVSNGVSIKSIQQRLEKISPPFCAVVHYKVYLLLITEITFHWKLGDVGIGYLTLTGLSLYEELM
jgi:hypothetical protein